MPDLGGFFHALLPLFIAVDPIGIAPLYAGLTVDLAPAQRDRVLDLSILVGAAVAVGCALLGKAVFLFLGITVADFQVAGGLILLGLAAVDLLAGEPRGVARGVDLGVVPLGVPIIVGPAVITVTIVMVDLHGTLVTVLALVANLAACWLVLRNVAVVQRVLGRTGSRALSKIVSLLLAAIGVRLVRQGLHD